MATITEDYISFEVAKLLKEKGFDGDGGDCECHMFYCKYTEERIMPICEMGLVPDNEEVFFAPTHQMAMKWLREVHKLPINIWYDKEEDTPDDEVWTSEIAIGNPYTVVGSFASYEDAVEAALKYSLENLI